MNINKRKILLQKKQKQWKEEKMILSEENKLKEEKRQFKNKKQLSMSKKIILFLFINCTLIELFTAYITLIDLDIAKITGIVDFSPIVTLIGAVVGEVIGFAIYSAKSTKENTQGGIVYQSMMNNFNERIGG